MRFGVLRSPIHNSSGASWLQETEAFVRPVSAHHHGERQPERRSADQLARRLEELRRGSSGRNEGNHLLDPRRQVRGLDAGIHLDECEDDV